MLCSPGSFTTDRRVTGRDVRKCLSCGETWDCEGQLSRAGGHSAGEATSWSRGLSVSADGAGVIPHTAAWRLRLLSDRSG